MLLQKHIHQTYIKREMHVLKHCAEQTKYKVKSALESKINRTTFSVLTTNFVEII